MSKYLDTSNKTQVDQIMVQCGRSSRSSWAKSVRSSFLDYYRKCNPRVFFLENGWEKVPNWECFFVNREKRLFLSVHVIDIKMEGKKRNLDPMWKIFLKDVDLREPTSFFDHVYLGYIQRECKTNWDMVDNYKDLFESEIPIGGKIKIVLFVKSEANIS